MHNTILIVGRLGKDVELNYTPSGTAIAKFSVATDRPKTADQKAAGEKATTDWIDIVAFGKTAEFCGQYLGKGRLVLVSGRLQIRSYTTQDGQQRKAAEVVADTVKGLDRAQDGQGEASGGSGGNYTGNRGNAGGNNAGTGNRDVSDEAMRAFRDAQNRPPAGRAAPRPASEYDDMDGLADPFAT